MAGQVSRAGSDGKLGLSGVGDSLAGLGDGLPAQVGAWQLVLARLLSCISFWMASECTPAGAAWQGFYNTTAPDDDLLAVSSCEPHVEGWERDAGQLPDCAI